MRAAESRADGRRWVSLGEVASFYKGRPLSKGDLVDGGIHPCVHYGGLITTYGFEIESTRTRCDVGPGPIASQIGDVLMPSSAEDGAGLSCASALVADGIVVGSDILAIRPQPDSLHGSYLSAVIRQDRSQVERLASGTTVFHLYAAEMAKFRLPLPPLAEQRAIAAALADADEWVSTLDARIRKQRQVAEALSSDLLAGRRHLSPTAGQGDQASSWELATLGEHVQIVSGGTPSTSVPDYWDGSVPWCTPTDITSTSGSTLVATGRSITEAGLQASGATLLPQGAVLLCSRATIGEAKIAGMPVATNQGFKALIAGPQMDATFLYYLVLSLKPELVQRGVGSTFLEVSRRDVEGLKFRLPTLAEQCSIAATLEDADASIAGLEAERAKAVRIKEGMMQALLWGDVRLAITAERSGS